MYKLKRNKILSVLLMLALLFSLAACSGSDGETPEVPDLPPTGENTDNNTDDNTDDPVIAMEPDCVMVRQAMIETTNAAAVAYLGCFDREFEELGPYLEENGFLQDYPFIADIPYANYITLEGDELYCIVPADEDANIRVYEWVIDESNDYMGEPGDLVYENHCGVPFLLKGNISETMPNMMVEITDSARGCLEYVPSVSMMNGTLEKPLTVPTIMDITPYDAMGYEYGFTADELTRRGNWITKVYTVNGEYIEGSFYFDDNGDMQFCYATEEGGPYEVYYEGTWFYAEGNVEDEDISEDAVIFELTLAEDNSAYQIARPQILTAMTFVKNPWQNEIYMTYAAGDYLFDIEEYFDYYLEPALG